MGPGAQTRNLNKLGLRYSCYNLMCHNFVYSEIFVSLKIQCQSLRLTH
jgi:hypothetical protein